MTRIDRLVLRGAAVTMWIAAIAGLLALGTWQVERRAWKLDLIGQVEARLAAPPVTAPSRAGLEDAYRRVQATGTFLPGRDSFVQAVTDLGPGWWVLTPMRTTGRTVLVNRGFVAGRAAPTPPAGLITVRGLLRLSEPGGGFLRRNAPALDQWYSRDVAAIAARRALGSVAPYFIDADATGTNTPGEPVGGLTVVQFTNNHLVYAITWYVLAIMTLVAPAFWIAGNRRARRQSG